MKRHFLVVCTLTILVSILLFLIQVQFDNKYTHPGPIGQDGILELKSLTETPLIYLTYGWEFYQDHMFTPSMLKELTPMPTTTVFLGQYGGFHLGEADHSPLGCATYRLTIHLDGVSRRYVLELPEVYGQYRLWINGQLEKDIEFGLNSVQPAAHSLLSFWAQDTIEIVVEVWNNTGIYSGLVYPPALGVPEVVWRLTALRSIITSAAVACALLLAVTFLIIGIRSNLQKTALAYACLCLSYAVYISRGIRAILGIGGPAVEAFQRLGYFGLFCSTLFILGQVCDMPDRWRFWTTVIFGGACLWLTLFPLIWMDTSVWSRLFLTACISWYKYGTSALLLLSAGWAMWRQRIYSLSMFCGALVFAVALVIDRIYPLFEPIWTAWPVETAGLVQVLLTTATLVHVNVGVYRDKVQLQHQKDAALFLAEAQAKQYQHLAKHINDIRQTKHDLRGLLLYMGSLCRQKKYEELLVLIDRRVDTTELPNKYGTNDLINAILSSFRSDADKIGASFSCQVGNDDILPLGDMDLSALLTNILQNAIDACGKAPVGLTRSIDFFLRVENNYLFIGCTNTNTTPLHKFGGHYISSKKEDGHGLGLRFIEDIISIHKGFLDISAQKKLFSISIALPMSAPRYGTDNRLTAPHSPSSAGITTIKPPFNGTLL